MTDNYELLTEASAATYIGNQPGLCRLIDPATTTSSEIGDGNLNLVFVCTDAQGRSLVLKQSLPYVRIVGPDWPLTADRSTYEAIGLRVAADASPQTAPIFYGYDRSQHVLAMEDLSHLTVWRTALNDGQINSGAADIVGAHVARTAFATSVLGRSNEDFRLAIADSTNPHMCRITEDLVFTEPLTDHEHNEFSSELRDFVVTLTSDRRLTAEVTRLKTEYMTRCEALVHGDFHTGSFMIGEGPSPELKAIDAEFSAYGPIGFDLGMLIGNINFAHARAVALGREEQASWLAEFPARMWLAFAQEFTKLWPERIDPLVDDGYRDVWLARIQSDAIGFAGCESVRRIVGFAKVSDIEDLPPSEHLLAARTVLNVAHRLLTDPPAQIDDTMFS